MVGSTASEALLNAYFTGVGITAQADAYVGLITVSQGPWAASTAYTAGETIYATVAGTTYIFECTTAGTSGTSAPSWNLGEGSTTTDNTVVWTEQTIAMRGGVFTEATGGGYARQAVTANSTNFSVTLDANNRGKVVNSIAVSYGTVTAALGWCVAAIWMTAATAGSVLFLNTFTTPIDITANSTPQLPANGESIAIG